MIGYRRNGMTQEYYPDIIIRAVGGHLPIAMKTNNASRNQNNHATFVYMSLLNYPPTCPDIIFIYKKI